MACSTSRFGFVASLKTVGTMAGWPMLGFVSASAPNCSLDKAILTKSLGVDQQNDGDYSAATPAIDRPCVVLTVDVGFTSFARSN